MAKARARKRSATPPEAATAAPSPASATHVLADALRRLDSLLGAAVEHQSRRLGAASLMDPWLGMHLDASDVARLLAEAGHRPLSGDGAAGLLADGMRAGMQAMTRALELTDVDLAVLLIALAPDLDLRYERIFGYLQDDLTHRRPSLDFIANLLAVDASQRIDVCARLTSHAPLRVHGVLVRCDDGARSPLAEDWRVDRIWRVWLLRGDLADALDARPVPVAHGPHDTLAALAAEPETLAILERACRVAATGPLRLWLHGDHGAGKHAAACAVAGTLGRELVPVDLRDADSPRAVATTVERAGLAACLFGGVVYVHGIGRLEQRDPQLVRALVAAIAIVPCHALLASVAPPPALHAGAMPLLRAELRFPGPAVRGALWRRAVDAAGVDVEPEVVEALAERFALSGAQIGQATAEARIAATDSRPTFATIAAAVRRQCGSDLSRIATRIEPRAVLANVVVAPDAREQLREICARVATRDTVAREWADGSVHARATGITALFTGPSGTGKTLSAEALANELGLDLYRIDLAGIVSKYIGETEKNLDRVFAAAAHANAVLFFDEAEALFGKRSEVKDAHDRYANIEVAYLLQKMEQFDGLAILATNLKQNLDEAFARRVTFTVAFPFPEEAERRLLWEALWPPRAPRADDVDLDWFARQYRLSGGNIRNTVMAAAHLAAADGRVVTRAHLLHATRREYQKLGKNLVTTAEAT